MGGWVAFLRWSGQASLKMTTGQSCERKSEPEVYLEGLLQSQPYPQKVATKAEAGMYLSYSKTRKDSAEEE